MSKLQKVKGFRDLLPMEAAIHRHIRNIIFKAAQTYGFGEINLPIMEPIAVFSRGLGESSDVVSKEMFLLHNRLGDAPQYALRPEGTASVVRAVIENGLQQNTPLKLYYEGPMFRYERPQKGRYRQFWQAGVELLGVDEPSADIEIISLGWQVMQKLNIYKNVELQLNTLGDKKSRENYRKALVGYLMGYKDELSADSQIRLDKNPLRILDSKDKADQNILKQAPKMSDYLTDEAKNWFKQVCEGLDLLSIPYKKNNLLVRGLDYYTHTAFEFVSTDETMGAQATILAGGRYDGLVQQLGGSQVSGVGWATGVDRLALVFQNEDFTPKPIAMIPLDDACKQKALPLVYQLRAEGFMVEQAFSGNMKKRLNRADKLGAHFALILGEDELQKGEVIVRNLQSGEQISEPFATLAAKLLALGVEKIQG